MPQWIDVPGDLPSRQLVEGAELAQLIERSNVTASGGSTGTIAASTAATTGSFTGTTTVVGSATASTAATTGTFTGTTTIVGSSAATTATSTASFTGTVGGGSVTGTLDASTANTTGTLAGTTTVVGAIAATTAAATGTFTGTSGEPATPTEPAVGRPRPRRFATDPTAPIVLPTIVGTVNATTSDAFCVSYGDVDPYHLLADDEELLLLA